MYKRQLVDIIQLSQDKLGIGDLDIEVEYQGATIGKYGLDYNGQHFVLTSKQTDCLARDKCGVPDDKMKIDLSMMAADAGTCTPGGGCC